MKYLCANFDHTHLQRLRTIHNGKIDRSSQTKWRLANWQWRSYGIESLIERDTRGDTEDYVKLQFDRTFAYIRFEVVHEMHDWHRYDKSFDESHHVNNLMRQFYHSNVLNPSHSKRFEPFISEWDRTHNILTIVSLSIWHYSREHLSKIGPSVFF